jgi:gamma-glutamylcysteine synthetase
MNNSDLVETFVKNYIPRPNDGTLRKIGIELEFPVVQDNGEAVSYDTIRKMFAWLEEKGWQVVRDGGTGESVEAVKSISEGKGRFGYEKDIIGTDVGYCDVETSLSPEDNLLALEQHWLRVKDTLLEYFSSENCHVLGYGVQPISHPSKDLVAHKGRYAFFVQDSLNRFIDQQYGTDLTVFATSCSNQCHIDVYREEAITAVNVLNGLGPLLGAITANAPVWRGSIDPEWVDIREIFWDKSWTNRIDQVGIPDAFSDFSDYVDRICSFRPLMVKRDGQYVKILNRKTFGEFLASGDQNEGETVNGERIPLASSAEDLHFHNGFAWWQARLASAYGTLEIRPCGQQPANATMSIAALALGLVENLSEAEALYKEYSVAEWRKLRFDVLRHALKATVNDRPVTELVGRALEIASAGLQKRGLGEEKFLTVLQQRLDRQATLADEVKTVFNPNDLSKFFDLVEIK